MQVEQLESRQLLAGDVELLAVEPFAIQGAKLPAPGSFLSSGTLGAGSAVSAIQADSDSGKSPTTLEAVADLQNFDGVTAPNLPAGWVNSSTSTNAWQTDATNSQSAPNRVFVEDIASISDVTLTSPAINVTIDNARLTFQNNYNTESSFDGGVLELSINGGGFTDIVDAGGTFIEGGYNSTIDTRFQNPIGGRDAWSGDSGGYIRTVVDLPATAFNQSVNLRWRFASDVSVAGVDWSIDSIQLDESPPPPTDDFGDAPSPYPTLLSENGARHTVGTLFLGNLVDTEADGVHSGNAVGDGADEDGVSFGASRDPGSDFSITVDASEAGGLLNAWIDWNQDGDWLDSGEQIFTDQPLNSGNNVLSVSVPTDAEIGRAVGRFRISTEAGLGFDGPAVDGEVEDYSIEIGQRRLNWVNRDTPSDRFDETFGEDAELARGVVDAVFDSWERVITDLNHDFFGGPGRIDITVSMAANGTGFGASAGASFSNGFPTSGSVTVSRGNDSDGDGNGDGAGFFLDPTPLDNSEFRGNPTGGAFLGIAQAGSPAQGRSDLFTLVNAEITHSVGLFSGQARVNNPLNGSVTNTFVPDESEGGGTGTYRVFDGPSVTHLMTSNNGGPGGQDFRSIVHTAGPNNGDTNQPVDFTSQFRGERELVGADGPGNAVYSFGTRTLVNDVLALVFQDAYGYEITLPQTFGTVYSILDETTGVLSLRGGVGSSSDQFEVSVDGDSLVVSIDIGNDVAGTGPNGDDSDIGAFVSRFPLNQVTQIEIDGGNGDDFFDVAPIVGVPIEINGGAPNFPNGGSGDELTLSIDGVSNPSVVDNGNGSGTLSSTSHGEITWRNIEELIAPVVEPVSAPQIASVTVNGGEDQRSAVTQVVVTFDSVVTIDSSTDDAFVFVNSITGEEVTAVPFIAPNVSGSTVVTFNFDPLGLSVTDFGSLENGEYRLQIVSELVTSGGVELDGDSDGNAGGDFFFGNEASDDFFRRYGDTDGNRETDLIDFAAFRATFGSQLEDSRFFQGLDSDGDDLIGLTDFAAFRSNFGS